MPTLAKAVTADAPPVTCQRSLKTSHERSKMKTSHFEGSIASWAAKAANDRDERTQRELAAFDFSFVGQWLVAPTDCPRVGINRETVGRYLGLAQPKPTISTLGSGPDSDSKPAISTAWSTPGRQSLCEPYSPSCRRRVAVRRDNLY